MPHRRYVGESRERGSDGRDKGEPEERARSWRRHAPDGPKVCGKRADQAIVGIVHFNLRDAS
jgi:hypothetical protein